MLNLDTLTVRGVPQPVEGAEIDAAEAKLGVKFPRGYCEFMRRYGRGTLGGLIRLYTPLELLSGGRSVEEWRARVREYWFWNEGARLLPQERALESVIIGDTVGGDELVFHPSAPDVLYVLPHDFEESHCAGEGLEAALNWFFSSGVLDEAFEDNSFEPY